MAACPPRGSFRAPPVLSSSDGHFPVHWMRQALIEARRARGRTSPNPPVGAVIVRDDGTIVGAGHTQPPGEAHAEIMALTEAGAHARGATLYVTLEPCAHHGRTPPCTEAIIAAGLRAVVVAVRDPFPLVNGAGITRLRAAGIAVPVGVCADEAWEVIAGFVKRVRTGLPLVTAKYAMTLDGRITTHTGHSRWITGEAARHAGHHLRDTHDAILVGGGTVRADNPRLTTRLPASEAGSGGPHHPLRVIMTRDAHLPETAHLLSPALSGTTLVACARITSGTAAAFAASGVEVTVLPDATGNGVDIPALLAVLAVRGVATVLVEGGATVLGAMFDAQLVDRVVAFIAPVLVGGNAAPGPVGGRGVAQMDEGWRLDDPVTSVYGNDFSLAGYLPSARTWRALPEEEA